MVRVGAYEAKTNLSSLLDRVAEGESITITKHGHPVAVMKPVSESARLPLTEVIADLREFRQRWRLGGINLRDMIEEGRR